MRVGLISLQHESNTFVAPRTTLEDFRRDHLLAGGAIREYFHAGHHEMSGFLEGLGEARLEAVPVFAARALPAGPIEASTFEALWRRLVQALDASGPLDGLLVAPHGAAVSTEELDLDGLWLSRLRGRLGADVPLIATLDPHANLSRRMVASCDAMVAYRTNPHLDQRQRGVEAALLMARTLRRDVRPVQAMAAPPVAINIERQLTNVSPCRELYDLADRALGETGVLSDSILLGFPYADVPEMGSACLVVTDNRPELSARLARELSTWLWNRRDEFAGVLVGVDEAVELAAQTPGTVGLLDMGDNVGGGSPGDGTTLVDAIRRHRLPGAFACLRDPEAVERALGVGVGRRVTLTVGGKSDRLHGPPLSLDVTVASVHDGRYEEREARHGGKSRFEMGTTVILRGENALTLMVTTHRVLPVSLGQITSCSLDPGSFRLLVIKGVHAPVAAYDGVCSRLIRVNTPGVTCADMVALEYRHRRRPLFPFEREARFGDDSDDP